MQREREDKLITILKNKLEPFVEGRTEEFVKWANSEARRLSGAGTLSYFPQLVVYIVSKSFLRI